MLLYNIKLIFSVLIYLMYILVDYVNLLSVLFVNYLKYLCCVLFEEKINLLNKIVFAILTIISHLLW